MGFRITETPRPHRCDQQSQVLSDGLILASASRDHTVRLWNAYTGQNMSTLEGHTAPVNMLAFSPGGSVLASASNDGKVQIWNRTTGQIVLTIEHPHAVDWVSFSLQHSILISMCRNGVIRMWSTIAGRAELVWTSNADCRNVVRLSPDGSTVVTAASGALYLRDTMSGQTINTIGQGLCTVFVFSSCGQFLAAEWQHGNNVQIFALRTDKPMLELIGHQKHVYAIEFAPNSLTLASGSADSTVRVWDTQNGSMRHVLRGHTRSVYHVAFLHHGTILASGSSDSTICIWNPSTGEQPQVLLSHVNWLSQLRSSPTESLLASSAAKTIVLWDIESDRTIELGGSNLSFNRDLMFSFDGTLLASGSSNGIVTLWNSSTGQRLHDWEDFHHRGVTALAFCTTAPQLALGTKTGTIQLWDPSIAHTVWVRDAGDAEILQLLFSPNGLILASLDSNRHFKLWNSVSGSFPSILEGTDSWYECLAFSSDSSLFASASSFASIRVWDIKTRTMICQYKLEENSDKAHTLAFSSDDHLLVSAHTRSLRFRNLSDLQAVTERHVGQKVQRIEVLRGNILLTEHGWMQLGGTRHSSAELSMLYSRPWVVEGNWLTYRGQNCLWLPEEYRGLNSIVSGNTIAVRHPSGLVSLMRLNNL